MFCCLAAMSITSCMNDDDDDNRSLSKEEKAQCLMAVKGNYSGNLIYAAKNEKNVKDVTDTLAVKWSITNDSTMTIDNFPAELLTENITDTTMKKALATAAAQSITCRIGFIKTSPVQYLINPQSPTYNLNYGGKNHKIQIAFYVNSYNSYGSYDLTKKVLQMQIIEAAVFLDGKQTAYLKKAVPFVFVSTKKE